MNEEDKQHIMTALKEGIEKYVNGNIRELRAEMKADNNEQNKKIDELMEIFKETSAFFKVSIKIAQFIIPMGAAFGMLYGLFRWIKG